MQDLFPAYLFIVDEAVDGALDSNALAVKQRHFAEKAAEARRALVEVLVAGLHRLLAGPDGLRARGADGRVIGLVAAKTHKVAAVRV